MEKFKNRRTEKKGEEKRQKNKRIKKSMKTQKEGKN